MSPPNQPTLPMPSRSYLAQARISQVDASEDARVTSASERTSMHDIMVQQERQGNGASKGRYLLQRVAMVTVLTLATPFLNDFLSLAKSGGNEEPQLEGHGRHARLLGARDDATAAFGTLHAASHDRALSGDGYREACEQLLRELPPDEAEAAKEALEEAEEALEEAEEAEAEEAEAEAEEAAEEAAKEAAKEARRVQFLDQLVGFAVVLVLVVATISFEYSKELIEESMQRYQVRVCCGKCYRQTHAVNRASTGLTPPPHNPVPRLHKRVRWYLAHRPCCRRCGRN